MKKLFTVIVFALFAFALPAECFAYSEETDGGYMGISSEAEAEEEEDQNSLLVSTKTILGNLGISDVTYSHGSQFDDATKYLGIDVSKWQGDIDWSKVANNTKRTFTFIRVGYRLSGSGDLCVDEYYIDNITEAYENGLDVGVYFFSQAITQSEAREEAQYLLSLIEPYKDMINLPVIFDFEYVTGGRLAEASLTDNKRANIVAAFCAEIEENGYTAGLYANMSMITKDLVMSKIDTKYAVWVARYNSTVSDDSYTYDETYDFWQYSSNGSISGISGRCDMNVQYVFTPDQVTNVTAVQDSTEGYVQVDWDDQPGVYGYKVYRQATGESGYTLVGTVRGGTAYYIDNEVAGGTTYSYKIKAIHNLRSGEVTGISSTAISITPESIGVAEVPEIPGVVSDLTVSATTVTTVSLSWSAVDDATGYYVYEYDSDGDCENMKIVSSSSTSCKFTGLKTNTEHSYNVVAIRKTTNYGTLVGDACDKVTAHTKPSKVKNVKASIVRSTRIKLTWSKVSNATGYIIYVYNSDTKAWERVDKVKTTYCIVRGLSASTTYKYKVLAYKSWSSEILKGSFSDVLKVKTAS
ncbi:MAG: fibronectin type III domain-containing protein [Eubacterium sp.]|nr:fibronectin type III domain-containing protein [Eubacterium sp.]